MVNANWRRQSLDVRLMEKRKDFSTEDSTMNGQCSSIALALKELEKMLTAKNISKLKSKMWNVTHTFMGA